MSEKEQLKVSENLIQETDRFWEDPKKIMMLIDLIFLNEDSKTIIPS